MRARLFETIVLSALLGLGACAKDLQPHENPDSGVMPSAGHITITPGSGGEFTALVEATSETEWRYLDLETQREVEPAEPDTSGDWDVAFQRFRVKVNGGFSGSGGVEVANVPGGMFAAVSEAPIGPYTTDQADSADADDIPDYAFNVPNATSPLGWYTYDELTHVLGPADLVFVIRSVEGGYFKVAFEDYYSASGTSGYPLVRIGPVAPPSNVGVLSVDVSGRGYVHLSLARREIVEIEDPDNSLDWDLAADEAAWQTNSGGPRLGRAGAKLAPLGATYESVDGTSTIGFTEDRMIMFPGPPGSGNFLGSSVLTGWFIYDELAHTATSKGLVYVVRTAAGTYGKLQVLRYDNPTKTYSLRLDPISRRVETSSATIDAGDPGEFVYFNLRRKEVVTPADPRADDDWDVAFAGAKLRTNSGTSGSGAGGALDPGQATLAGITTAETAGYVEDTRIPDPDEPGETYSGNAILAGWYEYTGSATVAKDAAYLVRTADGDYAKLKVRSWEDGRFTIDWAYTGPGETSF